MKIKFSILIVLFLSVVVLAQSQDTKSKYEDLISSTDSETESKYEDLLSDSNSEEENIRKNKSINIDYKKISNLVEKEKDNLKDAWSFANEGSYYQATTNVMESVFRMVMESVGFGEIGKNLSHLIKYLPEAIAISTIISTIKGEIPNELKKIENNTNVTYLPVILSKVDDAYKLLPLKSVEEKGQVDISDQILQLYGKDQEKRKYPHSISLNHNVINQIYLLPYGVEMSGKYYEGLELKEAYKVWQEKNSTEKYSFLEWLNKYLKGPILIKLIKSSLLDKLTRTFSQVKDPEKFGYCTLVANPQLNISKVYCSKSLIDLTRVASSAGAFSVIIEGDKETNLPSDIKIKALGSGIEGDIVAKGFKTIVRYLKGGLTDIEMTQYVNGKKLKTGQTA